MATTSFHEMLAQATARSREADANWGYEPNTKVEGGLTRHMWQRSRLHGDSRQDASAAVQPTPVKEVSESWGTW